MNRKGYTLIEIIGAIIILGIIAIIAVATFTRNMKGFRENYYENIERTLKKSGQEFFSDYRSLRPTELLSGEKIRINILEAKKYIDEVKDYNGDKCDGYILVVKENKNDYSYHSCLRCPTDNYYSKEKDKYCDDSIGWELKSTLKYDINNDDIYIYKGTTRDKLKELLYVGLEYIRVNSDGEEIVRSTDDDGDKIRVLPQDIDKVDVEKIGDYQVTYIYNEVTKNRMVHIYENPIPDYTIKKDDKVATNLNGDTTVDQNSYTSGEWAQKLIITFTQSKTNLKNQDTKIESYQWFRNGRWQDLCKPQNCFNDTNTMCGCTVTIEEEMNDEKIKFRTIDTSGKIGKETTDIAIRIDNTKPVCTLKVKTGTLYEGNTYLGNVTLGFDNYIDKSISTETLSGLKLYNIVTSNSKLPTTNANNITHTENVTSITYVGYVEDNAKNFNTCSITFGKTTKVNINFNVNGGAAWTNATCKSPYTFSGGTCKKDVIYTKEYGSLPTPTRAGYSFEGWYTQASGGTKIIANSKVTNASAHTLYAHWKVTAITPTVICSNAKNYIGKTITNYTNSSGSDVGWQILDCNNNSLYLIANNYIHIDHVPYKKIKPEVIYNDNNYIIKISPTEHDYDGGNKLINKDTTIKPYLKYIYKFAEKFPNQDHPSARFAAYMLDTNIWKKYKGEFADFAIGGPTIELFVSSYNKRHTSPTLQYNVYFTGYGLKLSTEPSFKASNPPNSGEDWLFKNGGGYDYGDRLFYLNNNRAQGITFAAAGSDNFEDHGTGNLDNIWGISSWYGLNADNYFQRQAGLRPVVKIKDNVGLLQDGTGYKLVKYQ